MTEMIYIMAAGAIGGFAKSLMENQGRVSLPKLELTSEGNYIHFGFLLNCALGALAALAMATTIPTAITAGMSSAFLGEKIVEYTPVIKKVN